MSFAERALLVDENRLLFKQNDEANRRKSTRSTIAGKAKVMSYEDIVKAKEDRAAKKAAVATGKGGLKRKKPCASGSEGQKGTEERSGG
jgi:hypothetical protein